MKRIMIIALTAGAMALTGCVSSPAHDRRVRIAPNLSDKITITDVRCAKGISEYKTFQANIENNTDDELCIQWKIQWLDADGIEIDSALCTWNDAAIQPYDVKGAKGTAPRRDAADMRFYVREME